jgi:hypothetical protein
MSELNYDIYYILLKYINPDDLINYCLQSKYFYQLYQENKNSISKHFLEKYQVNYTNPDDFIYDDKYNKVKMENYIVNGKWLYQSIFKLYMKNFYKKTIYCKNRVISSFPVYPNMEEFIGSYNNLTSFPVQPNMKFFEGDNNNLTRFPVQPNMTAFYGNNNQLTSFPKQPKMKYCKAEGNPIKIC